MTIQKIFCGGLFGWHPHLQLDLGKSLVAHSTGPEHPTKEQGIYQHRQMLIHHENNLILEIHHGWKWGACGPNQDPIHLSLAYLDDSNRALQLLGHHKLLLQVHFRFLLAWPLIQVTKGEIKPSFPGLNQNRKHSRIWNTTYVPH